MSVEFLGKNISHEYTIPSGIVTTQVSIIDYFLKNVPEVGVVTGKSTSVEKRDGNKPPIFTQIERGYPGSFINAVGLANPGAKETAEQLSHIKVPQDRFLLASIIGGNGKEFREVAETLYPYVDGVEANISCPHAQKEGQAVGQDIDLVEKIVIELKKLNKPVVLKLSPKFKIENYLHILKLVDGVTVVNTYGPEPFLLDGHSVLSNKVGGISGKQILEMGVEKVLEIRKYFPTLPIIHCGGLSTAEDIRRSKEAGANIHGIGSALIGKSTSEIGEFLRVIDLDVVNGTNYAKDLLKNTSNMEYRKVRVEEKEQLADDLFVLRFDKPFEAKAGQFVMLWSPEKEEKPFSIYNNEPFEVLVQKRGCFTEYLSKLESGNELYVRGPYGNSPEVNGRVLLVGGGTGIAALRLLAKENKDAVVIIGAKDKLHIPNMDEWESKNMTIMYTEDGSLGRQGRVTDDLEKIIDDYEIKCCVSCGPKSMIESVIRKAETRIDLEKIYSSEELLTMCGVGICGRCATKDGRRNCVDGTFI